MFVDEKAKGEVQVPKLGTLKLSEAIRIGAKKRQQTVGLFFYEGKSCALGAAMEGSGSKYREGWNPWDLVETRFGINYSFSAKISAMNDRGESRESIADWLESQGH